MSCESKLATGSRSPVVTTTGCCWKKRSRIDNDARGCGNGTTSAPTPPAPPPPAVLLAAPALVMFSMENLLISAM